jgi:hypothetical protein
MKSMSATKTAKLRVQTNITDPIQEELDQTVFKGTTPRPERVRFVKDHFMDGLREILEEPEKYIDLYLTGSLTTYQYSDNSDFDVSVFPDYDRLVSHMDLPDADSVRRVLVAQVIDKIDGVYVPGTTHPAQHFVNLVGNTPDDLFKPGLRSAWNFQTGQWFVPPEKDRVTNIQKELPLMFWRAKQMAEKMRLALKTDHDAAKRLFQRIHNKRTQDQRAGRGDFSEGNIIYKWLLHEGLFDELRNIGIYIAKTADDESDRRALWENPPESMLETLMIPFWNGRTPQEVAEGWYDAIPGVPNELILEAVVKAYNVWQPRKEESDRQADEIRRMLDEHHAKPPPRMWRWAWYEGKVLADECGQWDSDMWQTSRVHEELIDALNVPIEALMEHDMGDLQQARADDVYLGYVELQENGEWEFEGESYDLGSKEPPLMVQNDVIHYLEMNFDTERTSKVAGESMQVIYNFQEDRIILGTTAMVNHLPHTVVVGEYRDGEVILNQGSHQWLNTTYFKKLWLHSYPTYPLRGVHVRHEDGPKKVGWTDEPEDRYQPPQTIKDRALEKMQCLHCGSHLLQEGGKVWCPGCGWEPTRTAGVGVTFVPTEPTDANGYPVVYDRDSMQAYVGAKYSHHYQIYEWFDETGMIGDFEEGAWVDGLWYWYSNPYEGIPGDELDEVAKPIVDAIWAQKEDDQDGPYPWEDEDMD